MVAGASGFIGQRLGRMLGEQGYEVACIGRTGPDAAWQDDSAVRALIDGAALVINLAGKIVNCR